MTKPSEDDCVSYTATNGIRVEVCGGINGGDRPCVWLTLSKGGSELADAPLSKWQAENLSEALADFASAIGD